MVQEYIVKVYKAIPKRFYGLMVARVFPELVTEDRVEWFNMEGQLHRVDGPAIEDSDGTKSWWINGQRHRLDGPAFEHSTGYKEWWVNDQRLSEEDFNQLVNPIKELSVEEISNLLGYEVKIVKS